MDKEISKKTRSEKSSEKSSPAKDFLIVGIGASAGGVKALKEFFERVPQDSGMAYVVILHLSPEHESLLAEILQQNALIPVTQVQDEQVRVEPNHVYVIPPNKSLKMNDGKLALSDITRVEERRAPVDIFFRTLAESHDSHAAAVVLSGTGANGSMGMKRIKEKGGVVFVQDPKEAEYNDMPRNSIATGLVDFVLPVAEMPAKIIAYKSQLGKIEIPPEPENRPATDEQALRDIFTQLRIRTGHDFSNYKRATVLRRIERRMNVNELTDVQGYARLMREQTAEASALLRDLLISVTNFFRDSETFVALESRIIARLFDGKTADDTVRVWIAGCAMGEEAYSLAMLLIEHAETLIDVPNVQIFATDIDENAIMIARDGFYTLNDAADVSPERLRRFFVKEASGYRIRRELRERILFAVHNVIKDPPFSHLDLVSCRNLLIYLNRTAQKRVMEIAHFALNAGGFLFLGMSESADNADELFAIVDKQHHIYQSRNVNARISLPIADLSIPRTQPKTPLEERRSEESNALERMAYDDLHQRLLEQYAAPSVVINENYDILHLTERAGKYMSVAGGAPSYNLLKLIRPDLRVELRTALFQAVQTRGSVATNTLQIGAGDKTEIIRIVVRPILRELVDARGFLLVLFEETAGDEAAPTRTANELINLDEPARQLETELGQVRNQLRLNVDQYEVQTEELKASNEELQAMNEELRSASEELETGKEELQSINEELRTVNQELKIKIEELSQSNNDFQNLMASTDIGTLFLDRALRIKMFTPRARDIFNLIPSDIGRPLSDITGNLAGIDLLAQVEEVISRLHAVEREVVTRNNRWYLMRVLPYRTSEDRIDGVIITFLDITNRKEAEKSIRFQAHLLDMVEQSVIATDLEGKVIYWNRMAEKMFGWTAEKATGRDILELTVPETAMDEGGEIMARLRTGESRAAESIVRRRDGTTFPAYVITSPIRDEEGRLIGIIGVSIDITERKQAEEALRHSEEHSRLLIESATDFAIFRITSGGVIASWNSGAEKVYGWKETDAVGQRMDVLFTPEDRAADVPRQLREDALADGSVAGERWHIRKDGTRFFVSSALTRLKEGAEGFVKISRDMTTKLAAEKIAHDKEMLQKLVGAQEDERKRIARDLHDHLGQQLTALRLKLEAARKLCEDNGALCAKIDETQLIARNIDSDVDFLAWELRPAALDDLGLIAALDNYTREWSRHSGVTCEFHHSGLQKTELAPEVKTNFYRIAQEALNNTYKHAEAKRADVLLEKRGGTIVLIIEDDGNGFDTEEKDNRTNGLGIIGMRERAAIIGGTLDIESALKRGTTVYVRLTTESEEEKMKN